MTVLRVVRSIVNHGLNISIKSDIAVQLIAKEVSGPFATIYFPEWSEEVSKRFKLVNTRDKDNHEYFRAKRLY